MRKVVSFFGDRSALFTQLNRRAEDYARSLDLEYRWVPQLPFSEEEVVGELQHADAGIIDVEPYGEPIFSRIQAYLPVCPQEPEDFYGLIAGMYTFRQVLHHIELFITLR